MIPPAIPDYLFALLSAGLWALSAPVINSGLRQLPPGHRGSALLVGLEVAMVCGALLLALLAAPYETGGWNGVVALAGVLTFPLATGGYYLVALQLGDRAEIAAQFAKLKPLFSVALALLVLRETVGPVTGVALALLSIGLLLLAFGIRREHKSLRPLLFGLATALMWALGELCVRYGFSPETALDQTLFALAFPASLLLLPALWQGMLLYRATVLRWRWLFPFCLHGVLSFALAYVCFFHSIAVIGLARTVIITAFWPFLAIVFSWLRQYWCGQPYHIHPALLVAALLLLTASLMQVMDLV